ncbi:MAG: neutral/alkaline non-lysosomal ceramidase N-terminal domain-containing protein [Nitrososphaerota archaeon]|nr:neutral/alkaline non-lysosomal ceramidase N-terminal domain-containing protein [Nitrososphaerota archaeon]
MTLLQVGHAKGDITPPPGVTMDGYSNRNEPSRGVHDKLFGRALYFEDGESSVALISCDVCWFSDQTVAQINRELNKSRINHTLIFATHNHSGPAMTDIVAKPNESAMKYLETLPSVLAEIVESAARNSTMAMATVSRGKARLTFNRRKPIAGAIDPEIVTMLFRDRNEKPIAAILNYACHPTIQGPKNLQISADWPGHLASKLEENFGQEFNALFLNGSCGDVLPLRNGGSFSDVEIMVQELSQVALESLRNSTEVDESGLSCKTMGVGPLPPFGTSLDLHALKIANLVILGVPGEVFASTGLAIKESELHNNLIVASYLNGYRGYIPTRDAFLRNDYETQALCWVDSKAETEIRAKGKILCNSFL